MHRKLPDMVLGLASPIKAARDELEGLLVANVEILFSLEGICISASIQRRPSVCNRDI